MRVRIVSKCAHGHDHKDAARQHTDRRETAAGQPRGTTHTHASERRRGPTRARHCREQCVAERDSGNQQQAPCEKHAGITRRPRVMLKTSAPNKLNPPIAATSLTTTQRAARSRAQRPLPAIARPDDAPARAQQAK